MTVDQKNTHLTGIKSVRSIGVQKTYDLEVDSADHNFYANGIVVSNSHAASYSYLSAYTIFLKYKYPKNFYCECLKMAQNKADSQKLISQIASEMKFFNIKLLPPCFTKSKDTFSIEGDNIRFGFSCIKGISENSINPLKNFLSKEKNNKFEVFNAAQEAKMNVGILCALIQAGMLQDGKISRERLVFEAQLWKLLTEKEQIFCLEEGEKYQFNLVDMVKEINLWKDAKGKNIARVTRLATIKKKCEKYKEIYNQNRQYPIFASWWYEKKLLGYSYTTTLRDVFSENRRGLKNSLEIQNSINKSKVEGVFEVTEVRKGVSAKGNKYIKMTLADEWGNFQVMMAGEKYSTYAIEHKDPEEGNILFIVADKDEEICWLRSMSIQDNKVFLKLADIKTLTSEQKSDKIQEQ